MECNGSLLNILEIGSRWNTPFDAMWNLLRPTVYRKSSSRKTVSTLEHVFPKISTKGIDLLTKQTATKLDGHWRN